MKKRVGFALFLTLLLAVVVLAAINISQSKSGQTVNTSTTLTVTATGAGHTLVASVYEDASSSSTLSMSDGASQTWTQVACHVVGTSNLCVFIKENTASGITSITCNSTTSATLPCIFMEISGLATSSSLDGAAVTSGATGASTTLASGSISTTNANDILIYAVGFGSTTSTWSCTNCGAWSQPSGNLGNGTRGIMTDNIVSVTQSGVSTNITGVSSTDRNGILFALSNTPIGAAKKPPIVLSIMRPIKVVQRAQWP